MATLKGTWRFNDVLTAPSADLEQIVNFSLVTDYPNVGTLTCYASQINVFVNENGVRQMQYIAKSSEPDLGIPSGAEFNVYWGTEDGWNSGNFGEGIQTITIPTEQEVSDEFYAWFTENAVAYKTIKAGIYRFKDELVNMPEANEQTNKPYMSQSIDFTVDSVATYNGQSLPYRANCSMIQLGDHYVDGPELYYKIDSMQPDYGLFEFPDTIRMYGGATISNGVGYWYTDFYGEGIKQITITADAEVSPEFYAWFTENAKPAAATITYNGSTIANLFGGQSATLKCEGMKMESDVVVEAAEMPEAEVVEEFDGTITIS